MPTVLEGLGEEITARAQEFQGKHVRLMVLDDEPAPPHLPKGIPTAHFDRVAGALSDEEVDALLQAIGEGCERIDTERWRIGCHC
ncbi:MAG: hypothetical protein NZ874_03825 [Fimbriimonadales bacterium]|nr:hypothetical protein [Fimbriimonadales bacterium]